MKSNMCLVVGVVVLSMCSGCLSYLSYKDSEQTLQAKRAAIQPVVLNGGDGVGVGVDITKWETLKEQPIQQILAGLGDAILVGITALGAKEVADDGGSSKQKLPEHMRGTTYLQNAGGSINYNTVNTFGSQQFTSPDSALPGIYDSVIIINGGGSVEYNSTWGYP